MYVILAMLLITIRKLVGSKLVMATDDEQAVHFERNRMWFLDHLRVPKNPYRPVAAKVQTQYRHTFVQNTDPVTCELQTYVSKFVFFHIF